MPSADQSRWASSISLSDLLIQTARRRPFSQLSRRMPATWRPLPAPVPSPSNQPRRKRTAFSASSGAARDEVKGLVDRPGSGEELGMRLAGIDDALELRVGQQAVGDDVRRKVRPIGRLRRRDRRHRGRLHQLGRMRLSAGNADRLKCIVFVERLGDPAALGRRPVDGLIGEFSRRGIRCGSRGAGRAHARRRGPVRGMTGRAIGGAATAVAIGNRGGTYSVTQPSSVATSGATPRGGGNVVAIVRGHAVDHGQPRLDGGAVLGDRPRQSMAAEKTTRPRSCKPDEGVAPGRIVGREARAR